MIPFSNQTSKGNIIVIVRTTLLFYLDDYYLNESSYNTSVMIVVPMAVIGTLSAAISQLCVEFNILKLLTRHHPKMINSYYMHRFRVLVHSS